MRLVSRICGVFVIAMLLGACAQKPQRLLFVVPEQLPGGEASTQQQAELEEWMARQAGGFTRINGVEGGWVTPEGKLLREHNVLYLLSLPPGVPESFASELEGRILADFEQQEAWIQRW